jgi:hypothetical protein
MSCLLITYDLNKPGQKYDDLYEEIKSLGSWWHYLDSTWLVSTSLTTKQASDRLRKVMDDSDNLLVLNVTSDDYSGWLPEKAWEWIRKYL